MRQAGPLRKTGTVVHVDGAEETMIDAVDEDRAVVDVKKESVPSLIKR
jgi:hypothetical protein